MNSEKALPMLWGLSVGIITFQALRSRGGDNLHTGFFPLPQSFVMSAIGWITLSFVAVASGELAVWLGAGIILAQVLNAYRRGTFGGKNVLFMPEPGAPFNPKAPVTGPNGAQFWGPMKHGGIYDALPLGFTRIDQSTSTGTQGATGGSDSSPPPTGGVVQNL